jgi:hypothetical protein
MGLGGPEWVEMWVGPSGPARLDRIGFVFSKFIFKTIPENIEIVLKARKILRKFQTFHENSQRKLGHEQSK